MFNAWKVSGVPKSQWLKEHGFNPRTGSVHEITKDWDRRLYGEAVGTKETAIAHGLAEGAPTDVVSNVVQLPGTAAEAPIGRAALDVPSASQPQAWQIIDQWRRKQAVDDWKSADSIRSAVKLILRDAIAKDEKTGSFKTTLKPHEVRQLMQCLADCQRVQRLALGLSTENVGVDQPAPPSASNVEKQVQPDEPPVPTFIVEMSTRGRFLRPRPRRIS